MTIASCYVSAEGVVLGADSTSSFAGTSGGLHYFNHAQKVYELGEDGTLGVVCWGLGGLGPMSYRTLLAVLAEDVRKASATNVAGVMSLWIDQFWKAYWDAYSTLNELKSLIDQCKALDAKAPFDPRSATPDPGARTKEEEEKFQQLRVQLTAGFCLGGYILPDRTPTAFFVQFDPVASKPTPTQIPQNSWGFWGAPNMIQRLIFGADDATKASILGSGKWAGTAADLEAVLVQHRLAHPVIPIRDAIDFVHACIYSTIKALKFSHLSQICGGPIELAVVTTDRRFRWVRHKAWDAAIVEGE